ncbi:coiled-coil domain-containing protein 8 [Tamandua tetradactyla]|uniref:coiled-coil domain-containing protein 8 n=1 Tax=Tamandua tetradactyla TaxID=48850 RepID=UPI0040545EE2
METAVLRRRNPCRRLAPRGLSAAAATQRPQPDPRARPHPCWGGDRGHPEGSGQTPCQSSRIEECKMRRGEVGLTPGKGAEELPARALAALDAQPEEAGGAFGHIASTAEPSLSAKPGSLADDPCVPTCLRGTLFPAWSGLGAELPPAHPNVPTNRRGEPDSVPCGLVAGGEIGTCWLVVASELAGELRPFQAASRGPPPPGILGPPTVDFTLEILKTLEKSHAGGWFPWSFLPSPDRLILRSVPDVCKDTELDVLVGALRPVGTFRKIGKVFRGEQDATVGVLQIGDDVDYLLLPREVRLAGGVWRVISKSATKEAEFRERLTQFLEEEGRTLDDVARMIDKSTPHPPQPPQKPREPRVRRRVQQMVTPPPRLVVGTYGSSNASDSEFSDFETSREKGRGGAAGAGKVVRKMPVSYLGSKFLGSDQESEDEEEMVEAFLRPGEKKPSAAPAHRWVQVPAPLLEDPPGPQLSKADRWREYASQVSWGKLKQTVKNWAPRSFPGVSEAPQTPSRPESDGSGSTSAGQGDNMGNAGGRQVPESSARRWTPKINWASFRLRKRQEAASAAPETEVPAYPGAGAADNQRAGAPTDQGTGAADTLRAEAASKGAGGPAPQKVESSATQGTTGATPGTGVRKQVKTVRFQTPGRFLWLRKHRRTFWHTPRLPTLPQRVPRAGGDAGSLRVLRGGARAEAEQVEQEEQL